MHRLSPPHRPSRRRPRSAPPPRRGARWLLAPAALLLALAPVQRAEAQLPFFPQMVIDVPHIVESVANGSNIWHQLQANRDQLQALRDNVRKLRSYNLRDVTGFVDAVDRTLLSGVAVAYSSSSLVGDFDAFYRGADPTETAAASAQWAEGDLKGALGTLQSIREHAVQIRAAREDLRGFQTQIRSATTAQQIAEVQGTVQAYAVQEQQLHRQATLLQIDQAARAEASAAARRQYVVDVDRTARARALAVGPAMRGVDYNQSGIF